MSQLFNDLLKMIRLPEESTGPGVCWFCKTRPSDAPLNVILSKTRKTGRTISHIQYETQSKFVSIPRCGTCKDILALQEGGCLRGAVEIAAILIVFVLSLYAASQLFYAVAKILGLGDSPSEFLAVLSCIVGLLPPVALVYFLEVRPRRKAIKEHGILIARGRWKQHPSIKTARGAGFYPKVPDEKEFWEA